MRFNSTEAQNIAVSGELIGQPLGPSSTISTAANPSSSPSNTIPTSYAPISASPTDSNTNVGPIVGGVVGGVLGLLLIGVLIWWVMRRRSSFEVASPSMSVVPFTGSKAPTPAQVKMAIPVPQRAVHQPYPSYISFPASAFLGSSNTETGDGSPAGLAEHAPRALDHSWGLTSHPYATVGLGLNFTPPSLSSSQSVGLPSNAPQRMGSPSSRSMIARFVFPRRRNNRHSGAPSTMSHGSSTGQIDIVQPTPTNMGYLPQLLGLSPVPGQATLEPTPSIPPPQGQAPSPGESTSHIQATVRPSINPPGYTPPETAIPSPLPQPNPAIQAHMTTPMTRPFDTDVNRMIAATPAPLSPGTPVLPSYLASSSNILLTPPTPDTQGDLLPSVPERTDSPHSESHLPQGKV